MYSKIRNVRPSMTGIPPERRSSRVSYVGLLVACAPEAAGDVLRAFAGNATRIGRFTAGAPRLRIT